ncbi:MAG: aminotransferase class V-fold PLP-dependent enzyme [Acidobacteriota bacterium]|nr:aminotransferase class V-fold PLP-dependent enzyme [Acidobacteriota bacterium]HNQ81558.1 aminotransferase class V-fold PLP-dependent enzyme [Candidatus Aminicenantes bacterium]MDD8034425.1 aminotransferase class V-fold PLP-dependent enzyme [Acidobacteriota bacterium]MDW3228143.1 aminotransferase class V-fold PLP-dependent enzyme [Acidobacteriota bacterium]HNT32539.1 aminotransferase class V-fold PLP-dependent enzyme [Candidatus Aminicenantes bacterium]
MKSQIWDRRSFLRLCGAVGITAAAVNAGGLERIEAAARSTAGRTPEEIAADEFYWREVQLAYKLDRTLINLNNGFTAPCPRVVLESEFRYLEMINMLPVHYQAMVAENVETIRRRMAAEFGCATDELALTRGASESLQIVQNGLDLEAGDEVITTEQDYPRMLTTWDQRMRREGIKVTRLQFPVPATQDQLYRLFEEAITPRTKVFHFCHITNLTAQLFPVQRLARLARSRGIVTIVDGAHALGQFPFKLRDLECDAYGVSLHKWLMAPIGNGCLYVRREMIPKFWPLQAAPEQQDGDIRKFEAIGTHPWGIRAALGEALAFHQAVGGERKAARLRYLTLRWAAALKAHPRVRILTNLGEPPEAWGVAAVNVEGLDMRNLAAFLKSKYRIVAVPLVGGAPPNQVFDYQALRVSPNIYTTLEEIDTFIEGMEDAIKNGIPPEGGTAPAFPMESAG